MKHTRPWFIHTIVADSDNDGGGSGTPDENTKVTETATSDSENDTTSAENNSNDDDSDEDEDDTSDLAEQVAKWKKLARSWETKSKNNLATAKEAETALANYKQQVADDVDELKRTLATVQADHALVMAIVDAGTDPRTAMDSVSFLHAAHQLDHTKDDYSAKVAELLADKRPGLPGTVEAARVFGRESTPGDAPKESLVDLMMRHGQLKSKEGE